MYRIFLKAYHFRFFPQGAEILIGPIYFLKLQSNPNSDHTITVYATKKRTFRDPNSRPGETDPYMWLTSCLSELCLCTFVQEERFRKATKSHDDAKKSFVYYFMMCLDEMFKVVTRLKKILGSQRNVTMMLRKASWISMTNNKKLQIFFRFRKSQFG